MDYILFLQRADHHGHIRQACLRASTDAAFLCRTYLRARMSGPRILARAFAGSPLAPAARGLPVAMAVFPDRESRTDI